MQNWVAATKEGIRFKAHGLVPDRGPLQGRPKANEIMDGDDPTTYWTRGYLSDGFLPYLDGSQSFIVSANNDPWGHTADNDPLNDEFYYGSFYSPGYRATRMTTVLNEMIEQGPMTLEESLRFHMDSYSMSAHGLIPLLEQTLADIATDPNLEAYLQREDIKQAIQSLVDWDRMMLRNSAQAALFRIWYAYLSKLTLYDDLWILFEELDDAQPVTVCKLTMLIHQQNISSLLDGPSNLLMLKAMDQALAEIETRMAASGKADYTWGDLLLVEFDSPADVVENVITKDGGDTSMNVSQTHCWDNGALRQNCVTTAGSVYRFVVSFTEQGKAEFRFNMPYGNTQEPEDWIEGTYRQAPMSRSEVEAVAAEQYEIWR